jgi:Zn-dependent alcohol dehydrogenase
MYRAVRVMDRYRGQFPWADLITKEYPLAEAQQALEDVARQEVVKALIVP